MRFFSLIAITATLAAAESHPSWWMYASPEATALVGIQWNSLRHSPFGAAIEAELAPGGALAFPDLECLRQAREIVISSPALLAAEAGDFPAAKVKDQAQRQGLRRSLYKGLTLWLPEQADRLGVAQISEQLVLVGSRATLQAAIDRSLSDARMYSPLLPRAAHFSQTGDLWVVAAKLPDPLADLFVPLDADASDFLGQVSVRDGLAVEASFNASSDAAAVEFARKFGARAPSFPAVARGVEASADQGKVTITLQVRSEELLAALHPQPAAPAIPKASAAPTIRAAPVTPVEMAAAPRTLGNNIAANNIAAAPEPVTFAVTHTEASEPQIVRIYNLDGGTREIVLPPY
jgi:hypothetical protein